MSSDGRRSTGNLLAGAADGAARPAGTLDFRAALRRTMAAGGRELMTW